jgi:hypothetical protein
MMLGLKDWSYGNSPLATKAFATQITMNDEAKEHPSPRV